LIIIFSYLPWIILDSWKFNTSVNFCVRLALMDFQSQFLTSHVIFNRRASVEWVDQIISCKSSYFSICDVTSRGMFPTPQALKPNTYNNYFKVNLNKVGFGNGGHYFATITNLSHSCQTLAQMWLATFWSFRLYTAMAFPKMWTFILAWSWCRIPRSEVESLSCLVFFIIKPCTSFKCLVNNHLAQYVTMQVPTLHLHFNPTFIHFFVFFEPY